MKTKLCFILFLFLNIVLAFATDFDLDYAIFRGDESSDIVEVYLMIPRNLFEFKEEEGGFRSSAFVRIAFISDDTVRQMKEWSFSDKVISRDEISETQRIPDFITVSVPHGEYQMVAIVMDLVSKKTFREEKTIIARSFSKTDEVLSDIQLSGQMAKTTTENKFSKYFKYDIVPNASNIYGEQNDMIYAFCEVYNLEVDDDANPSYQVKYSIADIDGKEVISSDWIEKAKPGASAVEIKGLNISNIESGFYDYTISIKDEGSDQIVSAQKRFYIVKPDNKVSESDLPSDLNLAGMNEKELANVFGPLKYFATDKERKLFRKSNNEGKINVIRNFWTSRDPDPSTEFNEAEYDYNQRLNYVMSQFSTSRMEGWKTEMGRVYLVYGPPSEIERFPSSLESKPYQFWYYYEIEGGIQFIFVDKSGFGEMELVHSTARNELHDYNWQRWISPMVGTSDSNY